MSELVNIKKQKNFDKPVKLLVNPHPDQQDFKF